MLSIDQLAIAAIVRVIGWDAFQENASYWAGQANLLRGPADLPADAHDETHKAREVMRDLMDEAMR